MSESIPSTLIAADEPQPLSRGKEQLLEAAIELFGRDGYEGTSVRALAERAGVSFALIRVAFGSKEGLRDVAERMVFDEMFGLSKFTGFVSSPDDVVDFIQEHSEQFRKIKPKLALVRRCILEQRPAANTFIRRMIDHMQENGIYRIHGELPPEAWLQDPIRMILLRIGYILLAPNIEELMGIDLLALEEIERINKGEARLWQLVEEGLELETKSFS
jgi:AcrR family transcriptional regulator